MRSPSEIVDAIRTISKENKTTLQKLEVECGLGNGTIGKWGKRNNKYPPHDKLLLIANSLGVSVRELTGEEEQKNIPTVNNDDEDMKAYYELARRIMKLSPDGLKEVENHLGYVESKERK